MDVRRRGNGYAGAYGSLGGVLIALLVLALTRLTHLAVPPPLATTCAPPPLVVSLPESLPLLATATASARAAATPAGPPTATAGAPAAVPLRRLVRPDDPPGDHGLAISSGPLMPLVIPEPCSVAANQRRPRVLPCIRLVSPGDLLCAGGVVGSGRLSTAADAPVLAIQADRVTLRDAAGTPRLDTVQGYLRYDDPGRGLLLLCPTIALLEEVGPNARRFIALCSNRGEEGWAVSGQVTDGGAAAPDSVGLTIDSPDGGQTPLVGTLASGAIVVRNLPDQQP